MTLNFRNFKIAVVAASCVAGALVLLIGRLTTSAVAPATAHKNSPAAARPADEVAGYKNWAKVNAEPVLMAPKVAILCVRMMSPSGVDVNGPRNPHTDKFITVYVNDTGRRAMLNQKRPKFPVGSVIVKEKLPAKDSQSPELLTVMVKQRKGFNPKNGDWEYMVVDGTGTKIEERGRLENCQGCHLATPETDYVFRSYLSAEVEKSLK
ncbi:MAG TPA: cytochrome P460 family protein [Pyrinomonadaceae bacterium]|nr:cytochrome P460 family protein [Pyrinomonadaceae bacterium]